MYILVEIIHTEFQYISLIEMQKYNWNRKRIEKRKTWKKKRPFVPVGVTNRDKRSSSVPVARPGTKGHPLLSRTGVPGWETGTTAVSQPGQINVFVVVIAWLAIPSADFQQDPIDNLVRLFSETASLSWHLLVRNTRTSTLVTCK